MSYLSKDYVEQTILNSKCELNSEEVNKVLKTLHEMPCNNGNIHKERFIDRLQGISKSEKQSFKNVVDIVSKIGTHADYIGYWTM